MGSRILVAFLLIWLPVFAVFFWRRGIKRRTWRTAARAIGWATAASAATLAVLAVIVVLG